MGVAPSGATVSDTGTDGAGGEALLSGRGGA